MRLFKKKETPDRTDIVFEKWHTSFSFFQEQRFEAETSEAYSSRLERGRLTLEIRKKNLFAWTDNDLYRYDNFLLTAELGMDESNAYSSTGFLFRRTEDLSYYYFLVSSKGYYRLDSVINGTPSVIIDWTPCPEFNRRRFKLSISADGSRISMFINGSWVGHVSDDSLAAGSFSFAGQNYDEADRAFFHLYRFEVESRPVKLDLKRKKVLPEAVPAETRKLFAESRMKSGHYQAALIELRKALASDERETGLLMMAADCCINLEMYPEAARFFKRVPDADRDGRFFLQMAGLLYLKNDFIALRDLLVENAGLLEEAPAAYNLLGNAEYSLGNWENSADAYLHAAEMDGRQPLFPFNAARALQKCGKPAEAAVMYGNSARLYFRQERYDELAGILPFLEEIDEKNPETDILKAKLLFQDGEFDEAEKIFRRLIRNKTADSAVYYLDALLQVRKENSKKAVSSFRKAAGIEPDYYLYPFKFAEYLFMTGGDYSSPLAQAVELAQDDPWVLNLAGQAAAAEGDYASAIEFYSTAMAAAPAEDPIKINYSEALFLAGRTDEALMLLDGDGADVLNQRGNIRARLNDYEGAASDYEDALEADRGRTEIMLNLAAACIEADAYSRAEELLIKVLDIEENAQAYNLVGNLALLKGEYGRAESAYRKALETEPGYIEPVCNLVEFYVNRERLNDADMLLGSVKADNPGERFVRLKETVFRKRMNVHGCGSCSVEWVVPKKIADQPALKLVGEPPDNMPAGKCSSCGAVFCIGCAKDSLSGGRFVCRKCGAPLKLSEDWMRYIYHNEGF